MTSAKPGIRRLRDKNVGSPFFILEPTSLKDINLNRTVKAPPLGNSPEPRPAGTTPASIGKNTVKISNSALMINGARVVFWATLVITFIIAEMPAAHAPQLFPWDKAEHFTAFYVLTCLAIMAYPRVPLVMLGLWLSLFGGVIELVQALPFIHRDCDIMDWVADIVGVASACAPTFLDQWRRLAYSTGK